MDEAAYRYEYTIQTAFGEVRTAYSAYTQEYHRYESLKGALMSRGTSEIARLIKALGGNAFSSYGLAHLGDYQATLFSEHSNNRKYGESLITGEPCTKLAEGVKTSHALVKLGEKIGVELPICTAVYRAVNGITAPKEAISGLFLRKLKSEF